VAGSLGHEPVQSLSESFRPLSTQDVGAASEGHPVKGSQHRILAASFVTVLNEVALFDVTVNTVVVADAKTQFPAKQPQG
jgi:hypothetical protein